LLALAIHDDQVVRVHHPLAYTGRSGQDTIGIQPDRNIAIVGRHPALFKHQPPDLDDILAILALRLRHTRSSIVAECVRHSASVEWCRWIHAACARIAGLSSPTRTVPAPIAVKPVGARAIDRRNPADILGGIIPHARFNTVVILVVNFGLFLATVLYSMGAGNGEAFWNIDVGTLVAFGAKYNAGLAAGQWWRLVTAGFLHGGLLHILMNSWVLFDLGAQVEEIYGAGRMLVIYFVSTVFGFYASAVWSPAPSVGASAALMGLIGAMIALGVRHNNPLGSSIRATYIRWASTSSCSGCCPAFTWTTPPISVGWRPASGSRTWLACPAWKAPGPRDSGAAPPGYAFC